MKKFLTLIAAVLMIASVAVPASAQFRIGPRVGICVNDFHFNKGTYSADNRTGFTGGLMAEFTVPVIGVAFDASLMYVRREARFDNGEDVYKNHTNYIDIPVNFKYKIGIPVVSKIIMPYIATGPGFSFLTSKRTWDDFKNKKCDISWNFGFGLQLLTHLQVGATYSLGITDAVEKVSDHQGADIKAKNRYWTVTAAYLF